MRICIQSLEYYENKKKLNFESLKKMHQESYDQTHDGNMHFFHFYSSNVCFDYNFILYIF